MTLYTFLNRENDTVHCKHEIWQFVKIFSFITHGPDFIILICWDEMLDVMHNMLTKSDQVSIFTWKISGKIWYSICTGYHTVCSLYVYQIVDQYR